MRNSQLGAALWGVLVGLGLAIAIAACAQGRKGAQAPEAAGADAAMGRAPLDPDKDKIEALWDQIADWRESKGLAPDPLADVKRVPPYILSTPVDKIRECPASDEPPKTEECTDVCTLRDDICDNAASICRIADRLGDDEWARRKCNSAKAACKEATEKCCDCQAGERSAAAP